MMFDLVVSKDYKKNDARESDRINGLGKGNFDLQSSKCKIYRKDVGTSGVEETDRGWNSERADWGTVVT